MLSVDLTPAEIRGEILGVFSAARQSSSELFLKSHLTFPQLFPADFVGILEDWPFSPGHIFMLWYNSHIYISFFHLFRPPPSHSSFFHPSYVHPFSYSDNCLGLSLVLFLKGFLFFSLPVPLLSQNSMLTEVSVCPVIPCTKAPYSLRTECYRCSKRGRGLSI